MRDRITTLIQGRREALARDLGTELRDPVRGPMRPTPEAVRSHLVEEAQELYWNELAWEHITGEEGLGQGGLPELAFPGFLAFVRGLLLEEVLPDAKAPAQPRPDVVEDILRFLARRVLELEEGDEEVDAEDAAKLEGELNVTNRLLEVVLHRLHGLTPSDIERVEAAQVRH